MSKAIRHNESTNPLDWIDPSVNRGKILFVPDIVIFHKGTPKYIIEIVHSNPVSQKKIAVMEEFFRGHNVEVVEVFAKDLLEHTEMPKSILFRNIEFNG